MSANNSPTPYTDDDLRRAKDLCQELCPSADFDGYFITDLPALLNRLEAAEKCLKIADDEGFSDKAIEAHDNWLRACGK